MKDDSNNEGTDPATQPAGTLRAAQGDGQSSAVTDGDVWAIRQLFDLPESGDLFKQLCEWREYNDVAQVRLQNCVSNLLAEPVYEDGAKTNGIAVKFLMRLHLLAHEVGLERYSADNPIVAEALAALGDPAANSPESLAAVVHSAETECSSQTTHGDPTLTPEG